MPQRVLPTCSSHPSSKALALAKHGSFLPQEPEVSPRIWSLKEGNSSILYEHAYSPHTGTLVLLRVARAKSVESCDHPPSLSAEITAPAGAAEMSQISKDLLFFVQSNPLPGID